MAKITIVKKKDQKKFRDEIFKVLADFSNAQVGKGDWKNLAFEIRGPKKELVGGLYGGSFWGWAYVEYLWVDEKSRNSGLGARLMRLAEKTAKQRGCKYCFLSTFSFQAPGFYKKIGYKPFGKLSDFPKGHSRFWLSKKL